MLNIKKFIEIMSRFSANKPGVTRLPFTQESKEAFEFIDTCMHVLGLEVHKDKFGTIQGHLKGAKKESIILASHYDSVIHGGKYDGIVGIAVGLGVVDYFLSRNITPSYSLDVLALNDEEGVVFNQGFLSSKAITETLNTKEVYNENTSLDELLKEKMYGKDVITLSTTLKDSVGYIETHIEQGMMLENNNCALGIVDNIVGIKRYYATLIGVSGHAGTTPMSSRDDALVKASSLINKIYELISNYEDAVLTIGSFNVSPNAINVIPNKVIFSIDLRCADREKLIKIDEEITALCSGISFIEHSTDVMPISLKNEQTLRLEEVLKRYKVNYMHLNSGAGHDSQIFAEFMPTSMLFVPSKRGLSHVPEEYTDFQHIKKAIDMLCHLLE